MISVVITTFNEAKNLDKCLESIKDFADEIVVLDLGSTDNTKKICLKYKVKIFKHKFVSFVEKIRNYSISKANGDWILILDPDEILSDGLREKLKGIEKDGNFDAVNIPRKNIFFGGWIAHTNWWPDRHIRFFKKEKVIWSEKIHSYPKVEGKILQLPADKDLAIVHFGYDTLSEFLDRQNRYSTIEAKQKYQNSERFSWKIFILAPFREFLVRFIKHRAFLDGFYGFALTFFMMVYQMMVSVKLWEENQK